MGLGLVLWIALRQTRGWCAANRSKAFLIGWLIVGAGGLATVTYGLARDTLPHMSLRFRWQYWSASADLVADHWLTGVGRENFGRHYLEYKTIASPEEVANPHNLFVQAAADWGLAGLTGLVALLLGGSWALTGYVARENQPLGAAAAAEPLPSIWPVVVVGLLVVCGLRIPLLGTTDPNYVYYITITNGFVWLIAFCCFAYARPGGDRKRPEQLERTVGDDDVLLNTGLTVALVAFLIHDLINFAMFVPATATTFAALLGVRLSRPNDRPEPVGSPRNRRARLVAIAATLLVGAIVLAFVLPVARAQHYLARARRMAGLHGPGFLDAQGADRAFLRAGLVDPLDPTAYSDRAAWLASISLSRPGTVDG